MLNGTYVARLCGQVIIYFAGKDTEPEDGRALMGFFPMVIDEGDEAGQKIDATLCFKAKDGTIQLRTIENMQEVFGMEGANPFWLQFASPENLGDERPRDLGAIKFNIVVEPEIYDGKTRARVRWINPLGSTGGWQPKPADRKSVLAKYGSQFRALAGGAPVKSPAKPPTTPLVKSGPPTTPPPSNAPVATMEQAWAALCDNNMKLDESSRNELWFSTIREMFGTDNNSEITPQRWHQLKEKFTDNIPA